MDLRERAGAASRHPWEQARADFVRRTLAEHVELPGVAALLDVGAGDSWLAEGLVDRLAPGAQLVCWDVNYTATDVAQAPAGIVRVTDRPERRFPVVLALDVVEHVEDDAAFLADEIVPALAPGGVALITAPAHPAMYSEHDRMLGHHRRYRPAELRRLVGAHLTVVDHGSLFTTLVPPRLAAVGLERLGHRPAARGVGQWRGGPVLTAAVRAVLTADTSAGRWLGRRGVRLPGLSAWVVARRPDTAPGPPEATW